MIDIGLLASMVVVLIVPSVFVRAWPHSAAASGLIDISSGALLIGIVVGRLAAVAIDDPSSLTSLSDLLIIRSGVEFWPGLAAGMVWIALRAHHDQVWPAERLAAITTLPELQVIAVSLIAHATIRSVASIWLPHVGDGLTRQHRTSIAVAVITSIGLAALRLRARSCTALEES